MLTLSLQDSTELSGVGPVTYSISVTIPQLGEMCNIRLAQGLWPIYDDKPSALASLIPLA